jgi:hypothetical protein
VFYNFCRIHSTISVTPAIEAGIAWRPRIVRDLPEGA